MSNGNDVIGLYNTSLSKVINSIVIFDVFHQQMDGISILLLMQQRIILYLENQIYAFQTKVTGYIRGSNTAAEWIVNIEDDFLALILILQIV